MTYSHHHAENDSSFNDNGSHNSAPEDEILSQLFLTSVSSCIGHMEALNLFVCVLYNEVLLVLVEQFYQ